MNIPYALITGASEGLGKCLAIECARRKINLVLVALPNSGLMQLASFLGASYGVRVIAVEDDLTETGACNRLYSLVSEKGIRINMLINNAGIGGTFFFEEREGSYYDELITLNVIVPTILARLFLEDLKANGPAFILNIGSLSAMFSLPKKQVYAATKSYLLSFSQSLAKELRRTEVSVSVLCPGGLNTRWRLLVANRTSGTWLSRKSIMNPSVVAHIAIEGMLQRREVIIPGFLNRLFLLMDKVFPARLKNFLIDLQMEKYKVQADALQEGMRKAS